MCRMENKIEEVPKGLISSKEEEQNEPIQEIIGQFGKYQLLVCIIVFLPKFPLAFMQHAVVFLAPKVSYICLETGNETCPCEQPIYDRTIFTNTIIMQWDLICERRWLNSLLQTVLAAGTLLSSPLFGMASDRFGRRWPFLISIALQAGAGIAASRMTNYWAFAVCRFLVGVSIGGVLVTSFVILMEFIGKDYRVLGSVLFQATFNFAYTILPVFAYYFRNYADFHLVISIPALFILCCIFFMPETPRWLIATNKMEKAVELLEKVAKMNNRPIDKVRLHVDAYKAVIDNNLKKGTIVDLFRTPNMRKNILAMSFNWLACSFCYYGVSQYMGQLGDNVFLNVAINGGVSTIGIFGAIPLMKVIGRRTLFIVLYLVCASCLLVLAAIPDGIVSVIFAILGYQAIIVVFSVAYLYCSELFPTVVRNAAVGFSSMAARVGAMVAPFAIDLQVYGGWAPPLAFAVLPLIAALVTLLLPETKGCELMTTLEEGENYDKKVKYCKS